MFIFIKLKIKNSVNLHSNQNMIISVYLHLTFNRRVCVACYIEILSNSSRLNYILNKTK